MHRFGQVGFFCLFACLVVCVGHVNKRRAKSEGLDVYVNIFGENVSRVMSVLAALQSHNVSTYTCVVVMIGFLCLLTHWC